MANRGLCQEPCTLVYTLLDTNALTFDEFSLIVRSLHSYMVDSIIPNPEYNNVHVKLNYQASVTNATAKLGGLQTTIGITKLSTFVQENEFSTLEQLRRKFGFGVDTTTPPAPTTTLPRQRVRTRGGRGARVFAPRPAPYTYCSPPATQTYQEDAANYIDLESTTEV